MEAQTNLMVKILVSNLATELIDMVNMEMYKHNMELLIIISLEKYIPNQIGFILTIPF